MRIRSSANMARVLVAGLIVALLPAAVAAAGQAARTPAVSRAGTLVDTQFVDGKPGSWPLGRLAPYHARASLKDGAYVLANEQGYAAMAFPKSISGFADGTVTATLRLPVRGRAGVVARYSGGVESNYLGCWLDATGRAGCDVWINDSPAPLFATHPLSLARGEPHTLTLELSGSQCSVFTDGRRVYRGGVGGKLAAGRWGLYVIGTLKEGAVSGSYGRATLISSAAAVATATAVAHATILARASATIRARVTATAVAHHAATATAKLRAQRTAVARANQAEQTSTAVASATAAANATRVAAATMQAQRDSIAQARQTATAEAQATATARAQLTATEGAAVRDRATAAAQQTAASQAVQAAANAQSTATAQAQVAATAHAQAQQTAAAQAQATAVAQAQAQQAATAQAQVQATAAVQAQQTATAAAQATAAAARVGASLTLSPSPAAVGGLVHFTGTGYTPFEMVRLTLSGAAPGCTNTVVATGQAGSAISPGGTADVAGSFTLPLNSCTVITTNAGTKNAGATVSVSAVGLESGQVTSSMLVVPPTSLSATFSPPPPAVATTMTFTGSGFGANEPVVLTVSAADPFTGKSTGGTTVVVSPADGEGNLAITTSFSVSGTGTLYSLTGQGQHSGFSFTAVVSSGGSNLGSLFSPP